MARTADLDGLLVAIAQLDHGTWHSGRATVVWPLPSCSDAKSPFLLNLSPRSTERHQLQAAVFSSGFEMARDLITLELLDVHAL